MFTNIFGYLYLYYITFLQNVQDVKSNIAQFLSTKQDKNYTKILKTKAMVLLDKSDLF